MQRKTEQRQAISDCIKHAQRPLSVQEILESAQLQVPNMGIATVYRNIKALVKNGWIQTVELPGEAPRYELADMEHHHHFHCRKCSRVFDINACPSNLDNLAPPGFTVIEHEIILYGHCPECTDFGANQQSPA